MSVPPDAGGSDVAGPDGEGHLEALLGRVRRTLRTASAYHLPSVQAPVRLDANESPYPPPPALLAALADAVRDAHLERYPDPRATRLRALVAADLRQPEGRLVFGNGSDELIGLLCQTFAEPAPGDDRACIVHPAPSFSVYRIAAAAAGMDAVEVPLGAGFAPDAPALDAAVATHRPSLVFLATPNNPTGTAWPRADVVELLRRHPATLFVLDEAYVAYGREDLLDLVGRLPNAVVLRTCSKVGLAALRLGVLVAPEPLAAEVEKVRPPYNLSLFTQVAGAVALDPARGFTRLYVERAREVAAERERLQAVLATVPGVEAFPSAANLILIRVADAPGLWRRLIERGVLVRNLDRPGALRGCLRITVGLPDENRRLIGALRDALNEP